MKLAALTLLAAVAAAGTERGLPVRGGADAYPARGEDYGVAIAAEAMDTDTVRSSFSTDLRNYLVVEVAVWPRSDKPLDLASIDFSLKTDPDRSAVRPASTRAIAAINQKRGQSRRDDITLFPTVGVTTGSWGTGTNVGVGVGIGGTPPGPASTDRDRQVMETELEDRGLPEATITKPAAGYLYFPISSAAKKRGGTYQLEYELGEVHVRLDLPAPK
jgi:hypothetical protein